MQLSLKEACAAEFSTIESFESNDLHAKSREDGQVYTVTTVTLNSLLQEHQAPAEIDYMSVDTEGSELKILSAFDFDQYKVKVITVEHNFTANWAATHSLLISKNSSGSSQCSPSGMGMSPQTWVEEEGAPPALVRQ